MDRQTRTGLCVALKVGVTGEGIEVSVETTTRFEVRLFPKSSEDQTKAKIASVALAKEAPQALSRLSKWNLYGRNEILVRKIDAATEDAEEENISLKLEISDDLATQLREATTFHNEVEAVYNRAKKFLASRLDYPLGSQATEVRSAANYIASCMRADGDPFMGSWNREKSGRLLGDIEELIRRKQMSHPGFLSAVDGVRTVLYTARFPNSWASHPPAPRLLAIG